MEKKIMLYNVDTTFNKIATENVKYLVIRKIGCNDFRKFQLIKCRKEKYNNKKNKNTLHKQ